MRPSYHRIAAAFLALAFAQVPAAARAASLVVEGAGYGHGVGMSQEGALGYAEHGWSYTEILAHYYTGTAIGTAPSDAIVRVMLHGHVRRVPLEQYVRGVVSAEVSADWPMAALEAQAVASRTYALTAHAGGSRFDVYADTRSQVYLGRAAETTNTNAAVTATAGQIVTYDGQPAITYFFASSGGRTESVQNAFPGSPAEPWLVGVADPYDTGPMHHWKLTIGFHTAAVRLKGLLHGAFRGIQVLARGSSPRILSAYVLGSRGRTLVTGGELAQRLGLYDTWAHFSVVGSHGTHTVQPEAGPASLAGVGGAMATAGTGGTTAGPAPEALASGPEASPRAA